MPQQDGRRLTVAKLMAGVAAWGALLAWLRSPSATVVVAEHPVLAWGMAFCAALAFARYLGAAIRDRRGRGAVAALMTTTLIASVYLGCAHSRVTYLGVIPANLSFRYPDRAIFALGRWFDARRPVPKGVFKIHGEFPRVRSVLGMLALVLLTISGWLAGLLWNRPDQTRH